MKRKFTESEKEDLELLLEYEIAGRILPSFMFIGWMNTLYSKWITRKVIRKYQRFVEFKEYINTNDQ